MRTRFVNLPLAALGAATMVLAACDDGNNASPQPAPAPSPTPTPTSFNVTRCLNQQVAPGVSVANLVVPDTLTINLAGASGFPNGRDLDDPVIDVTLAVIFLDLTIHPATTFAALPLNPRANDRTFSTTFPFLAPPQGNPPLTPAGGANFNFRTDPASAYARVDRMGMPAVATALISTAQKNAYNDDSPVDDATGKWAPELTSVLTGLTNALADDLQRAGLTPCATPA